jgi:hypothetical protein
MGSEFTDRESATADCPADAFTEDVARVLGVRLEYLAKW